MKQLILNIPDDLPLEDNEALLALASKLYELGKLSLGQAANVSGLSKEEKALNAQRVKVSNLITA